MRLTILGAGAMGCLFGALLADVAEVRLLDRSDEPVEAIRRHGLRLVQGERERLCDVPATTDPAEAGGAGLVIVLVKAGGTAWAAEMARRTLAPGGLALTLQNGLGNREILVAALGARQVWQGVTAQGATLLEPGRTRHAGSGPTHLETRPEIAAFAADVAGLFEKAGLESHLSGDLEGLIWGKLVINAGINALTAVLRVPNGALLEIPAARRLMERTVAEAVSVAEARGIRLPYSDPQSKVVAVCRATAANRSSMLQDVLRGRPTEIDAINGAIVREAHALGLTAPCNETLADLVQALAKASPDGAF